MAKASPVRNNFQRRLLSPSGETREISTEDMERDKFCEGRNTVALAIGRRGIGVAWIPNAIRAIKGFIDLPDIETRALLRVTNIPEF